jgi:hypothetical protein
MRIPSALAALLLLAAAPASAQMGGFAGSTVGLPATGVPTSRVPPNPFASNYPSAPPPGPVLIERRDRRAARGRLPRERVVRGRSVRDGTLPMRGTLPPQGALLPPGRIPQ